MNEKIVEETYNTNEQARAYINAFAVDRGLSVPEVFSHKMIKEYVTCLLETDNKRYE